MARRKVLMVGLVALLVGCTSSQHNRQKPGQVLAPLPPLSTIAVSSTTQPVVTYTVQEGDTFGAIAKKLGVSADALALANGIVDRDRVSPGEVLVVPATGTASTSG